MNQYLEVAKQAVKAASEICRDVQKQLVKEDTLIKKDRSPVTVADYASQASICRVLKERFPQMPIVGEEDAADLRKPENKETLEKIAGFLTGWDEQEILTAIDYGNGEPNDLFWTLDPIDGTKGFLRGDQYAVALALIKNGEPVLGVLGCPNLTLPGVEDGGVLAFAVQGEGAFYQGLNGGQIQPLKVAHNAPDGAVRFLESVESGHANHGLQGTIMGAFGDRVRSVRYDSQVKYAVLSAGMADVYLRLPNPKSPDYREKIWDHAAGVAIVREAGGKVSDMFGKPLDFTAGKKLTENRGVVVTNGVVHDEIIRLIRQAAEGN